MNYAFPFDEVSSLASQANYGLNDVLGDYVLTAHIIATDESDILGVRLDTDGEYGGELLRLARELGHRLLPAFEAAGVDSIYEYMFKGYVYFGGHEYLRVFEAAYNGLLQYSRDTTGGYAFYNVHMRTGEIASSWIDALSAYFPGLMVLAGDVDGAESAYMLYYHIWNRFRAMPERFNLLAREPDILYYLLRPEFIESTYYLYRATLDPFYLDVGEMILTDMNELMRTSCGYASIHDVLTHTLEDRMDSYVLSETFKYLYLLFDEDNPLHRLDNGFVFTTEGHVLLPLSPVRNGSAQYPRHSSFSKRKLVHDDQLPALIKPALRKVDNIRRRLAAEWKPLNLQSPLERLHAMQRLNRALQSPAGHSMLYKPYLLSLHATIAAESVPLRNDYYNVGALVYQPVRVGNATVDSAAVPPARNGTAVTNLALAFGQEFDAMCSVSSHLFLSQRHEVWKSALVANVDTQGTLDLPGDADTWLSPNTRQVSITDYMFARATTSQIISVDVSFHPKGRQGLPLFRDIQFEQPDLAARMSLAEFFAQQREQLKESDWPIAVKRKQRSPHDRHRRREYAGRLAYFSEMSLYRSSEPALVPQPTVLTMLHLRGSSAIYGCEEYTPREQRLFAGKVIAAHVNSALQQSDTASHPISMPVVIVDSSVIDEIEEQLVAGCTIQVELL
ncbi:hypothetical protein LPJ63_001468 [Coemansia sp. RSA 2711]|nr:hypothetical protein LPJ63_001468 [Coemansia sp. RSA 2711]